MYPLLFELGTIEIRSFYFFHMLAFISATLIFFILVKKKHFIIPYKFVLPIIVFLSVFIGAKILFIIMGGRKFLLNPNKYIFSLSGFIFYGGLLFTIFNVLLFSKITKIYSLRLFDFLGIVISFAQGIGRIGCLLGGCCFGKPTTLPWGIQYPENMFANFKYDGSKLHPTPVYSMIANFFIVFVLLFLNKKKKFDGQIILLYLIFYSITRFFIEFFRGDYNHYYFNLTISQLISVIIFIIGVTFYMLNLLKERPQ